MTERPILFSAPMIQAILAGTKTQTRRAVRKQFAADAMVAEVGATTPEGWQVSGHSGLWWDDAGACIDDAVRCPFGIPGDKLWVREAWGYRCSASTATAGQYMHTIAYRADDTRRTFGPMPMDGVGLPKWRERDPGMSWEAWDARMTAYWRQWRPSMFMPRWASRITLKVTGVRVERLQQITRGDAMAEGCPFANMADGPDPREWFADLWRQINGPASWDANPWVWCVSFKRV